MTIYYHGLPLGLAQKVAEDGELLSPEEQRKKEIGWDNLTIEQKQQKIEQIGGMLSALVRKPIRTEEDLFRALSPFLDQEYESRFRNLTFSIYLDEAQIYSSRYKTSGVILGLEFPDNGRSWVKTPKKSLDDLRQVVLNPAATEFWNQIKELFRRYPGIEFCKLH